MKRETSHQRKTILPQNDDDFIEAGAEANPEVTKEVDGKKVQTFASEEVEELVVAQVHF